MSALELVEEDCSFDIFAKFHVTCEGVPEREVSKNGWKVEPVSGEDGLRLENSCEGMTGSWVGVPALFRGSGVPRPFRSA